MNMIIAFLILVVIGLAFLLWKNFQKFELGQKVATQREQIREEDKVLDFHLGDVLSLYTGKDLSPRGIAGIHRILNFLHGQELYDYQLSDKATEALPWITLHHPEFAELKFEDTELPAYWAEWLDDQITRFGATVTLHPIPLDQLKPVSHKEAWEQAKKSNKEKIERI